MSEHVRKLQVVDQEKFNALLNLLHKEKSDEKVLQDATNTPERAGLIEAESKMRKSVARNSPRAGLDKIQFLKKKQNYKESLIKDKEAAKADDDEEEEEELQEVPGPRVKETSRAYAIRRLRIFFNNKNVTKSGTGNLIIRGRQFAINHDDLIQDLMTDKQKGDFNLDQAQLQQALIQLDKVGLPVSHIRSKKIIKLYKEIKKGKGRKRDSDDSDGGPSTSSQATSTPLLKKIKKSVERTEGRTNWRKFRQMLSSDSD